MIREIYKALNIFSFLVIAIIICVIQSAMFRLQITSWMQLDLLLPIVVYLSLNRPMLEGAILTIVVSHVAEIHSASPMFLLTSCYLIVFLSLQIIRETFLVGSSFFEILLAMIGGVIWKFSFLLLMFYLGNFPNVWKPSIQFIIPYLLVIGLSARPAFFWLAKLDRLTQYRAHTNDTLFGQEDP